MGDQLPKNNISRPEEVFWQHKSSFGDVEVKWQLAQLYRSQGRDVEAKRLEAEIEATERKHLRVRRENRRLLWIGLLCFLTSLIGFSFITGEKFSLVTLLIGIVAGAAGLVGSYFLFLYFDRTGDQQN